MDHRTGLGLAFTERNLGGAHLVLAETRAQIGHAHVRPKAVAADGQLVQVFSRNGRFRGRGCRHRSSHRRRIVTAGHQQQQRHGQYQQAHLTSVP